MKKKLVIGIIIGIVLLLIGAYLFVSINKEQIIIAKANYLYGTGGKCDMIHHGVTAPTKMKCDLCNEYYQGSAGTCMCENCARITNRCVRCGKINDIEKHW